MGAPATVDGQDPVRVKIANLEQDVRGLSTEVRQLRLEIEELRRENAALRAKVDGGDTVTREQLNRGLRTLRSELEREQRDRNEEIVQQVTRQIERLASQTQEAMEAMAKSIEGQPRAAPTIEFSDDYPKEGIAYTVQPGDTLSGIAGRFGARVQDIQNANRIGDPRQLRAGQNIFIPIRDENNN